MRRILHSGLPLLLLAAGGATAQEKPMSLSGQLATGAYTTSNRTPQPSRLSFVPLTADFDWSGYIGHPDFFTYEVKPQATLGPQATEAGFIGGNGVSVSAVFLKGRNFPLKITYNNLQREDVFFGSLMQLSGFRSFNHDRSFDVSWEWKNPRLPHLSLNMGRSSLSAEPHLALIPDYHSRNRYYRADLDYQRWGWTVRGLARRDKLNSDFVNPLETDRRTVNFQQEIREYQGSAQRELWHGAQLTLLGGATRNLNRFAGSPFNQNVRYGNAGLSFGEGRRLQGSVRAGYTSNLLGAEIQRALTGLIGGDQTGQPNPEILVFLPLRTRVATTAVTGNLRYQVYKDLSVFCLVNNDQVSAPETEMARSSSYRNVGAGAAYHRAFSWANVNGQYMRNVGRLTYGHVPGSMSGDALSLMVQRGSLDTLELTGSVSRSRQSMMQLERYHTGGEGADFGLGRRIGALGLSLRGGLGFQRSFFRNGGLDYFAEGLSWRANVDHRLFQIAYTRNGTDGNTMQGLLGHVSEASLSSALLAGVPLRALLSTSRSRVLIARATPFRRVEASLTWTQGRQVFEQTLMNDYDQLEFRAGYNFRLLKFEGGIVRYEQTFMLLSPFLRSRLYVRVVRSFEVF